jgi:hypothetical protein
VAECPVSFSCRCGCRGCCQGQVGNGGGQDFLNSLGEDQLQFLEHLRGQVAHVFLVITR